MGRRRHGVPDAGDVGAADRLPFGLGRGVHDVEIVTVHEIAHEWAPLQVATNEGREAWLDEGFADYATIRALAVMFDGGRARCSISARCSWATRRTSGSQFVLAAVKRRWTIRRGRIRTSGVRRDGLRKGTLVLLTLERHLGEQRFLTRCKATSTAGAGATRRRSTCSARSNGHRRAVGLVLRRAGVRHGVRRVRGGRRQGGGATVVRRGDGLPGPDRRALHRRADRGGSVERRDERIDLDAHDGPLVRVDLDPDRVIRVEPDAIDNGLDVRPRRVCCSCWRRAS